MLSFKKLVSVVYWLLVLVIPLCASLQSTLQVIGRVEKQQWIASFSPFVFYIQLKPDAIQYETEPMMESISKIEGLQHVQIDRSIPAWEGSPELSSQWEQLWEKYLPYFIYASVDLNQQPLHHLEEIAAAIKSTPGVMSVEWDQERFAKLQRLASGQERQSNVLSAFFSAWLLLISVILLCNRPNQYHRRYAVRHGVLGAGSFIHPEWVLMKLLGIHTVIALLVYGIGLLAAWFWLSFSVSWETLNVYQYIIAEGLITTAALPAAVLLAGWWLPKHSAELSSWHI